MSITTRKYKHTPYGVAVGLVVTSKRIPLIAGHHVSLGVSICTILKRQVNRRQVNSCVVWLIKTKTKCKVKNQIATN